MKWMIVIAALVLAACGQTGNHSSTTATTQASTATSSAPRSDDGGVHSIVGAWTDTGDCSHVTLLNQDGSYHGERGDGRWSVAGDQLTMTGRVRSTTVTMHWIDDDHVELTIPGGASGVSQRCETD